MNFVKKNKKILLPIIVIFIVSLTLLLLYSNFIYKEKDDSDINDNDNPKYLVLDSESPPIASDQGDTNEDIVDGKYFKLDDSGNKINSSSKLAEKHEVNDFIITDLYLTSSVNSPDYAFMMFNIENNSNVETNFSLFFKFKDDSGNVTYSIAVSFPSLEKNVVKEYSFETYYPIIDAYDYELEYIVLE